MKVSTIEVLETEGCEFRVVVKEPNGSFKMCSVDAKTQEEALRLVSLGSHKVNTVGTLTYI